MHGTSPKKVSKTTPTRLKVPTLFLKQNLLKKTEQKRKFPQTMPRKWPVRGEVGKSEDL